MPTIWLCGGFGWLATLPRSRFEVRRSSFDVQPPAGTSTGGKPPAAHPPYAWLILLGRAEAGGAPGILTVIPGESPCPLPALRWRGEGEAHSGSVEMPRGTGLIHEAVGDDVRSLIIPRQTGDQRLLTSSPTILGPMNWPGGPQIVQRIAGRGLSD